MPTPSISFEKSCGSVPVIAWLMIAPPRSASGERRYVLLSASAPFDPLHLRQLFGVFGGVRVLGQAFAVVDQELLQVRARVGVERVEHLVELHRVGGLR